jgi:hypothetical protein
MKLVVRGLWAGVKGRLVFAFDLLWMLAALAGLYIGGRRNKYLIVGLVSMWAGYSFVYSFVQTSPMVARAVV